MNAMRFALPLAVALAGAQPAVAADIGGAGQPCSLPLPDDTDLRRGALVTSLRNHRAS